MSAAFIAGAEIRNTAAAVSAVSTAAKRRGPNLADMEKLGIMVCPISLLCSTTRASVVFNLWFARVPRDLFPRLSLRIKAVMVLHRLPEGEGTYTAYSLA